MDTQEKCPACGRDPYEYVDVGIGLIPVAVNCCEVGQMVVAQGYTLEDARAIVQKRQGSAVLGGG